MKTQEEIKSHKRKQNIIAGIIVVVGTFLAFLFFGPKNEEKKEDNLTKNEKISALVEVVNVSDDSLKISKLKKTVSLTAGDAEASAISEFSGRIKTVNFEVGDRVAKGQVLATFDQSSTQNSPKLSLQSAQNNYNLLSDNLNKTKDLVEENIDLAKRAVKLAKLRKDQASTDSEKDLAEQNLKIAKDQKDQAEISAEIQLNGAKIQLEQARTAVDQSKVAYAKTFIKAPISGVVSSKKINQEDFLTAGSVVASIVGNGKAEIKLFLNKEEIERIKLGDEVEIIIDGRSYAGKIKSYSSIANNDNGRFEVKIISDQNLTGSSNQTAEVILNAYLDSSKQDSFFVPLDAVSIGQTKKEVFIVEDGKAKIKNVELGKIIGTKIEILDGIEDDDILIVGNSRNLQDGQAVRIKD